jgi:RNA polymerase sigma factor (sigma-70 family)
MDSERPFTGWISLLARDHTHSLVRVARAEGLSAADAVDAVQEAFGTFLLLPQARELVDHREDSARLLSVVVRNAARNLRRRHHRARTHVDVGDVPLGDAAPLVDELIERAEAHVRLAGCVKLLSDVQRSVVTLRMFDELSGEAVASSLGLTSNHVAVLLHRAKKELETCLGGEAASNDLRKEA